MDYAETHRLRIDRREMLQVGGMGACGLGLTSILPGLAAGGSKSPAAPRAKSVVVLFLYGAPSQMDTLDPKPNAPQETRGEFKAISTSIPGVAVCEHLPNMARNLHRVCLIRSLTHASNNHAVSVALSALRESNPAIEANGKDPRHQPYFGSVLEYLWARQGINAASSGVPLNLVLPWALNQRTDSRRWQHHAAWLGKEYNPVTPLFVGQGSREVGSPSIEGSTPILTRFDPWDGVTQESTLAFPATAMLDGIPLARLNDRYELTRAMNRSTAARPTDAAGFDRFRAQAFEMIANPVVARALDVSREPLRVRERYGMTLFGQSTLAARRLIEIGVRVVTVFWDTWTDNNAAWDTHHNHHPRLKDGLLPKFDQTVPAFLDDMASRGLLDETLVMVISEHGRTPTISPGPGGGREHWSGAYWGMFFGAGIRTGQVIGATDRQGGYPISYATHPSDILATAYLLLGFDPHEKRILDRAGRPKAIVDGRVVREMLT